MKTKTNLLVLLVLAVIALAVASCKKSEEDPKPVHVPAETNLDSAKTLFTGSWRFQSVTLTQGTISATTSNCAKTQFANAGFTNDDWQLAEEQDITFKSATDASYHNLCTTGIVDLKVAATENEDGTVNIAFTDPKDIYIPQRFVVNVADITTTQFKAFGINGYGYTIVYIFARQ